jgi:Domain of unknown function (DUF5122) beta-propeller
VRPVKPWVRVTVAVAMATPVMWTSRVEADGEPATGFGVDGMLIDSSFNNGDEVFALDLLELRDGSIMVTGSFGPPLSTHPTPFVAKYTAAGQPDPTFGNGGVILPANVAFRLAELGDGRVLATGLLINGLPAAIARDGALVASPPVGIANQLIQRPDGAIVAPGVVGGTRLAELIRPDGTVDPSFRADIAAALPPGGRLQGNAIVPNFPPNGTLLSDGRLAVAFSYHPSPTTLLCGVVVLLSDGTYDPTFGVNGLASTQPGQCRISHFVDDEIRLTGVLPQDPALLLSSDGEVLGQLDPPFDSLDLAFEGTGFFYSQTAPDSITAFDPLGDVDPTFGVDGTATVPMDITGFKLLDSGDILASGHPDADPTALGIARIHASFGTALQPPAVDTTKFVPVPPSRILDTREGTGAPKAKLGTGGQIDLQIAGVAGVPDTDVSAVVLNVTATGATQAGFVSVYPSGTRRPIVSNLNLETAGQTAANLVTVKVGANGRVTLFSSGGTDLVADVAGYYTPAFTSTDGRFQTAAPERILDTRTGLGAPLAKLPAGGQIDLQVTGRGPVPAAGVEAVVLNVTGDQASLDGFVTAWPTGADRPVVSNLNLVTGETRANLVIVPVGAGGRVSLFTSGGTELIADVAGWFTDPTAPDDSIGLFVPITPTRVLDTRQESTAPTAPVSTLTRLIGSTSVVPPDSTIAVATNITVTQSGGPGFVTAWPAGSAQPLVSNLNSSRVGQTIPNAAIVPLGNDHLSLFTQSGAHLIVDINGWYTNF